MQGLGEGGVRGLLPCETVCLVLLSANKKWMWIIDLLLPLFKVLAYVAPLAGPHPSRLQIEGRFLSGPRGMQGEHPTAGAACIFQPPPSPFLTIQPLTPSWGMCLGHPELS